MDEARVKDRLRLVLNHVGTMGDPCEACKTRYPLREVLLLGYLRVDWRCNHYDEIADRVDRHRGFLSTYAEYHLGTP